MPQIAAKARRKCRKAKIGLIIVDYLQLINGSVYRGHNRAQEITEITNGLKALAKELGVPIVAVSQLSRNVEHREDKRPQLADLRDSGSIEQDADAVMFVYRESYYLERVKPDPATAGMPAGRRARARQGRDHPNAQRVDRDTHLAFDENDDLRHAGRWGAHELAGVCGSRGHRKPDGRRGTKWRKGRRRRLQDLPTGSALPMRPDPAFARYKRCKRFVRKEPTHKGARGERGPQHE
jgi:hypothetical protein